MHKHVALYISNKNNKYQLIERIVSGQFIVDLSHLKCAEFSERALNKFIDEEVRHGDFNVITSTKNSLLHSSEGERKKALLKHLLLQKPEYLIADNVYGNLDITAQKDVEKELTNLGLSIPIIQITKRRREVLSFIEDVYVFESDDFVLYNDEEGFNEKEAKGFTKALPQPYHQINDQYNPLIKFNNVTVAYGDRTIVNGITWEIKSGEFWQLVGPNGSGKSTLLSLISGDNPKAYNQDITLFGIKKGSGESVWDLKKKIGYFSSEFLRGFARLHAIENMIISGFFDSIGLYKIPTDRQMMIAQEWLHVLGMYSIKNKPFLSLSRGHQRLVLIARAMVKHPPLLILDEPTNGLDDGDAALFSKLVNKIAIETNTAILYVSHRKEENLLNPDFIYELQPQETGSIGKLL